MIELLRSIADHLELDGLGQLLLVIAAKVVIVVIAVVVWYLGWTWMFNFFGN